MAKDEKNNNELYAQMVGYFETSLRHPMWTSFLKNAQNDFEFYEGDQWTAAEKKELSDRGQPDTVQNEIKPFIDKVKGQYTQQRTRIGFVGRNVNVDEDIGNLYSDLALYVQQKTDYEYEEKDSFQDGIKCGFGCIETGIDYEDNYPKILLLHEDSLNMYPDPYSKKYDMSDARFVHRAKWVHIEDALASFPNAKDKIRASVSAEMISNAIPSFKKENYYDDKNQRVRLIETWYKTSPVRTFAITQGGATDITDFKGKALLGFKSANPDYKTYTKAVPQIRMCIWCSGGVIDDKESPYEHGMFPFVFYFCDRRKDGEPVGIIRALKAVQMEINKRRSKALHLLSTNRAIYEENAVQSEDDLREEMARPDGLIAYKKGYKFETETNVELAQSQMALLEDSKNAIKRIAGADMGPRQEVRSNQQLQRQQAAQDIVIVDVFDNLRRTRKIVAKHIYWLIKQYYDQEMVFNVTDNLQQSRQVKIGADHLQMLKEYNFDVVVSEMPETTTIQQEQFTMIADFMKSVNMPPNMAMATLPILIQLSQIRDKKEILETLKGLQQPPPEEVKISLAMTWSDLDPMEKAKLAEKMGMPDLAQFEMQSGREPSYLVKARTDLKREAMKADADVHKAEVGGESPEEKAQELELKREEHAMKLSAKERETEMKLRAQQEQHAIKSQQAEMSHRQQMAHAHEKQQFAAAQSANKLGMDFAKGQQNLEMSRAKGETDLKLKKEASKLGKNNQNKPRKTKRS